VPDSYQAAKLKLAAQTATIVAVAYTETPADEFVPVAANAVTYGRSAAFALSDVALAQYLGSGVLGLRSPDDDYDRLSDAFRTILDDEEHDTEMQIGRLAESEVLSGAQDAWGDGMRGHGVEKWTRGLGPEPCEICQGLADDIDGSLPTSVSMTIPHPTCSCVQEPVEGDGGT
jgi:hypothetical protein